MKKAIIDILIMIVLVSTGCSELAIKESIFENYYLVASDEPNGTCLSYHDSTDGSNYTCLLEATVFAVGYNNNYMIVKQHPRIFPSPPDKTITNYYIIPIRKGMDWRSKNGLMGPFTLEEFAAKRKELSIPNDLGFTKVIDEFK